jgi:hypothetical protein
MDKRIIGRLVLVIGIDVTGRKGELMRIEAVSAEYLYVLQIGMLDLRLHGFFEGALCFTRSEHFHAPILN